MKLFKTIYTKSVETDILPTYRAQIAGSPWKKILHLMNGSDLLYRTHSDLYAQYVCKMFVWEAAQNNLHLCGQGKICLRVTGESLPHHLDPMYYSYIHLKG